MKRFYLPVAIGVLLLAFWVSPDAQVIAAGVAIFLFGMLMLEDGFKFCHCHEFFLLLFGYPKTWFLTSNS